MNITNNGDGTWTVSQSFGLSLEALENIAEGIEEGEIEGGFVVTVPAEQYDTLDPKLVKRLGAFVRRGP
jgi:hypothetical protein